MAKHIFSLSISLRNLLKSILSLFQKQVLGINMYKNNKGLFAALLYSVTLFLLTACDSTEPENLKSPRDYTWTADTVYNPKNYQTHMKSIWGSSENDIYMCGHSSGPPGGLWHYDGSDWRVIDLFEEIGHSASLTGVSGTSAQNVWVVGYARLYDQTPLPYVIQFNGSKWIKHDIKVNTALFSVFANDIEDIWICGSKGIVGHYDKIHLSWQYDTIRVPIPNNSQFHLYSIMSKNGNTYLYGNVLEFDSFKQTFYIYQKKNENWELLDSFIVDASHNKYEWGTQKLHITSFNKLFTVGFGLWDKSSSGWTRIIPFSKDFRTFHEKGQNNMIIAGSNGAVYHYNGTDWQDLNIPNDDLVQYSGVYIFNDKIIMIGTLLDEVPQKTIVFSGN